MNYSWIAHYMNKYPGGKVECEEDSIKVYCAQGRARVCLRKNGADQWTDESAKEGFEDRHDLAPIPKEARAYKHYSRGYGKSEVTKSEEHDERKPYGEQIASQFDGRVPSIPELEAHKKQQAEHAKKQQAQLAQGQAQQAAGDFVSGLKEVNPAHQ